MRIDCTTPYSPDEKYELDDSDGGWRWRSIERSKTWSRAFPTENEAHTAARRSINPIAYAQATTNADTRPMADAHEWADVHSELFRVDHGNVRAGWYASE